jgi:hypothetical protein
MLLFPEPLGPVIAIRPLSRFKTAFLNPNDLKP